MSNYNVCFIHFVFEGWVSTYYVSGTNPDTVPQLAGDKQV